MRTDPAFDALVEVLRGRRVVALTGAGCSTESGIPDYRGPDGRFRERAPMRYREFVGSAAARRRYWARSAVGWPRFSRARPNPGHRALAALEGAGLLQGVITQNVDGLHHAAGSRRVVELHGSLGRVRCLDCGGEERRSDLQRRLLELNPGWAERWGGAGAASGGAGTAGARDDGEEDGAELAPDGDAEVAGEAVRSFRVPECWACGGVLKPDVVFFGESVPADWVEEAWRLHETAQALLVVGSSLAVFSGRRFVYRAVEEALPVAVVNLGPTRADESARVKVEARAGEVLPRLVGVLEAGAV